jgi:predicted metal-dependent hydrolase
MSRKSGKIADLIGQCRGRSADAHYLGYFECFNQQLFYEAHDVLEELWLEDRQGPNGAFYKGLIQLAGAFVHLQKDRVGPAGALFKLARTNLETYPAAYEHLNVAAVLELIHSWVDEIQREQFKRNPLGLRPPPNLTLQESAWRENQRA